MQTRRSFVKHSSIAATGLMAFNPLSGIASIFNNNSTLTSSKNIITILHTGNILQQFRPLSEGGLYNGLGGLEHMAAIIKAQKNKHKNVLLLDAGNATTNNLDTLNTLQLMQNLGYDAVKIAANEINFNAVQLNNISNQLPLLASNYQFDDKLNVNTLPYSIVQKGKYKIAIITAGARVRNKSIRFKNPISEANKLAEVLKSSFNCNLVICISSLGYKTNNSKNDVALANTSTHIDVIIGADDLMATPAIVRNINKEEVVLNYSAPKGLVLGKLQIEFDEDGNKKMIHFDNLMVGTPNQRWKRETA